MKLKLTWRIWLLIIIVGLSLLSIFSISSTITQKGVLITSVETNSTAFEQGLRQNQIITEIDNKKIASPEDFSKALEGKYNTNESVKIIIKTKDAEIILFSKNPPEITVSEIPKTRIKMGLDLAGGSRALVQAQEKELSSSEVQDLVDVISNRLNVYGISDLKVISVSDLTGNNFVLIEIAGATPSDLENLISTQGKFEAKIGNEIIFVGGEESVTSVARSGQQAGIESCNPYEQGYFCKFRFAVYLSEEAAKRHAEITDKLDINISSEGNYLSEKLDLYLDDKLVDSLLISESLKGRVTTQIEVSGSGTGKTREEAYNDAERKMNELQTILITGSLPFKLEIVKLDTISPVLGKNFIRTILLAGLVALTTVLLIVLVRYRNLKSTFALLITSVSEIIIILGIASFIKWNLDLPAIAGILAVIGTGIDSQIIILDESRGNKFLNIKQRLKRALAIILGAYFTSAVSLFPLLWASAGLLKGFAVTTIVGITIGVLITRPAFSDMIKGIEKE